MTRSGVACAAACLAAVAACAPAAADAACGNAERATYELSRSQARSAMNCLLASERRALGRRSLKLDSPLRRVAQEHATDQALRGYRGHVTPEGDTLADRLLHGVRLKGWRERWEVGEAVAWGTGVNATPSALFQTLLSSPDHRRLVLGARYRAGGVGIAAHPPAVEGAMPGAVVVIEVARLK